MSDLKTMSEPMLEGLVPNVLSADAPVFFGVTGDLAHKKIFPALQVEEAWRMVDPVVGDGAQVFDYEPGSWGPPQADRLVAEVGG